METYISMLRGINILGRKPVGMVRLAAVYEEMKCRNVRTYIQSGNVVFDSAVRDEEKLARSLERGIAETFGFPVSVLIRTAPELAKVLKGNPFLARKNIDRSKLHVTFLVGAPTKDQVRDAGGIDSGKDEFVVFGREVFLFCPGGYGKTKLSNGFFEKKFAAPATTRNWNTVNKLYEMANGQKAP
jgi:uncharacterized protein (DUF1697 family)